VVGSRPGADTKHKKRRFFRSRRGRARDAGLQADQPYALSRDAVRKWADGRTADMASADPEAQVSVYHEPGSRRLKDPDWEPVKHANLLVNMRLAAQNGFGPDGSLALVRPLQEILEKPPFEHLRDRIFVTDPNETHCTLAYRGLQDLSAYGLPQDWDKLHEAQGDATRRRSPEWHRMVTAIVAGNRDLVRDLKRVAKDTDPFTLRVTGWQVLGNCIVAVVEDGGDKVNQALFDLRTRQPGLKGNDPTISPLDQNKESKTWGMAAHITVAVYGGAFSKAEAAALQEALNARHVDVEIPMSHLSLDLHAFRDVRLPDGTVAGEPVEHIARIDEFALGQSQWNRLERDDFASGR
jgi:hypothetical protein